MLLTAGLLVGVLLAGAVPEGRIVAFWLLTTAAPVLLMREFLRQMAFAHLQTRSALVFDGAVATLQLGLLVTLSATGRLNVATTLAAMTVAGGVPAVVLLAAQRRQAIFSLSAAARDFLSNWIFARWALASHLLASSTPHVMPWVVALTHGEADTGLLGASATLVGLSNTFLLGLCNFLSPRAARAYAQGGLAELRSVLRSTALLFVATLGLLAVLATMIGEQIAVLVYGPQFAGAGPIVAVLSLSVLANSIGVTAGNGLWALERPRANFVADLGSLCVVVVAACVCVPLFGPLGAAIATLAGTTSDAAVRLWILRRTMRELAAAEARA
jgi:O-antigen/teichoic acid export membrane protein